MEVTRDCGRGGALWRRTACTPRTRTSTPGGPWLPWWPAWPSSSGGLRSTRTTTSGLSSSLRTSTGSSLKWWKVLTRWDWIIGELNSSRHVWSLCLIGLIAGCCWLTITIFKLNFKFKKVLWHHIKWIVQIDPNSPDVNISVWRNMPRWPLVV